MSDEYYYDPTAESGYVPPADEQVDNWDLQGAPLFVADPRANSGLTNVNPYDEWANTYYDPSVAGPGKDISGPSMSYDPATGLNTLYDPRTGETFGKPFGGVGESGSSKFADWLKKNLNMTPSQLGRLGLSAAMLKDLYDSRKAQKAAQIPTYKWTPGMLQANRTQIAQAPREVGQAAMGQSYFTPTTYTARAAEGGLMGLAAGGVAKKPRYLDGPTDGMADKINTDIDGKQAAKLSHGEFVIPADVVSHLGNGNSKAGADVLYKMMDRVRKARTGTKKQGKQINPEKFTPGGIAGYAGGGAVAFNVGGAAATPTAAAPAAPAVNTNLTAWSGPYVQDYLSKGFAAADKPYEAYTGQLAAGASPLQKQAFDAYSNLNTQYSPVAGTFTGQTAQQYMNPYLSATLDPQLSELNRQNQITQMGQQAKLAQAGGYGGSRDALMRAENARNLGQQQSNLINTAYSQAFDKGMGQFNTEQANKIKEAMFGANYGLESLAEQAKAGAIQRGIEADNIAAQKAQFDEQRRWDLEMPLYKQKLLSGLPVNATPAQPLPSFGTEAMQGLVGLSKQYPEMEGWLRSMGILS